MLLARDRTAKVAIMGLGGVGKTQLMLELLFRIRDVDPGCSIIWIPVTDRESLHQAYLDAAQQLGIRGCEDDKKDVKKLVQEYLGESTGRWLLVFDNADDMDMWFPKAKSGPEAGQGPRPLTDYLPQSKQGAILFTTRNRKLAVKLAYQNVVEVPAMGKEVAAQLLERCLIDPKLVNSRQDTSTLLSELTCLPLAIVQAAAYINENGIVLADYLSLLKEQEEEVIDLLSQDFEDEGRYGNVKNPIATTWLLSFEQIRHHDPLAAEYLSFMACVEPKNIPRSLLPPGPTRKKEIDAIGTLDAYSFIIRRPADTTLDLHRLVHLATRNWLGKEKQLRWSTEKAIMRLDEVFPDASEENRSLWRTYLTHVRYVIESNLVDNDWETRINLMWRYVTCLHQDHRWDEAEIPIKQVIDRERRIRRADHLITLETMNELALAYMHQDRWDAAEKLQVQVMEMREKILGVDHPDTLVSLGNLAATYSCQGRWDAAEELQVQVMEMREKILGLDHPDTLVSLSNLATTYSNQGRWDAAEELQVQVMEIREKKLGVDHPHTLVSMSNLAATYILQGRWDTAEELEERVMETMKEKLRVDHPDTLASMNNLAIIWKARGRTVEATRLMSECVQCRHRVLGVNHPDSISSVRHLAEWEMEARISSLVPSMAEKGSHSVTINSRAYIDTA